MPMMVVDLAGQDAAEQAEDSALAQRLEQWAGQANRRLFSFHKGRIVKRVGSGLMMEFADSRSCLQAAFALGQATDDASARASAQPLKLRCAAHLAKYGADEPTERDAQMVADLARRAEPGEVLLTAELRDQLADGLDADFEDLGDRRPRPSARHVRLFRAHSAQAEAAGGAIVTHRDLRPGLAVIPFKGGFEDSRHRMIGDLIADGVIARLSHSLGIRVIARQSTTVLRDYADLGEIERHLGASFVLSGSYSFSGKSLVVRAQLADARTHALLWSGQLKQATSDLLVEDSVVLHELARDVAQALGKAQVRRALARPLPRLDSSYLMLAGISMTHSYAAKTFARGRDVLGELAARHPELALPHAWLGMWHALNVVKGSSGDAATETRLAREQTRRALDAEPENAMALAVEGYIQCQLMGDPGKARHFLNAAIEANPSEPMAWLFKSLASVMWGLGSAAVTEAYIARALSPVDPLRYFFDLLTGTALWADSQHEHAIASARRSLRANRNHVPTLRLLAIAQAESGQLKDAKETMQQLLAEAPKMTVASYLGIGSDDSPMRQRAARALRKAGLPER